MSDRARLAAFAAAVIMVFGASYGIGAATDPGDGGPDDGPAPITTTTIGHGHG